MMENQQPLRSSQFAARETVEQVELGTAFAPRFDAAGLLPAIVVDAGTAEVLMLGHMTEAALRLTIDTSEAHFWSRSRGALWRKGEHSGFALRVVSILIDDDQDALVLKVEIEGPGSCHVGYRSCFYRELRRGEAGVVSLAFVEDAPAFDAARVYAGLANPTRL
jgi:phosphoribosyl-AMP cyclohydrolase